MSKKILSISDVKVIKSLYKHLLVLSTRFDKYPQSKTLIYRRSTGSNLSHDSNGSIYYSYLLDSILTSKGTLYKPLSDISLKKLVKKEFHQKEIISISIDDRIDVAFAASRKLSSLWNIFTSIDDDDDDDEDFEDIDEVIDHNVIEKVGDKIENRNKLNVNKTPNNIIKERDRYSRDTIVSKLLINNHINNEESKDDIDDKNDSNDNITATSTNNLQPGVLLLAHPMIHGPLHRTVILLLEHNDQGSYGVVINRVTDHSLSTAVKNLPNDLIKSFQNNDVSFGGMVRRVQYLHDLANCGGNPIPYCTKPMFYGGQLAKISNYVKYGNINYKESNSNSITNDSGNNNHSNNDVTNNMNKSRSNSSCNHSEIDSNNIDMNETESKLRAKKFKFIVGCCTWDEGMLAQELTAGYWISSISQPDLILEKSLNLSTKNFNNYNINNNIINDKDIVLKDINNIINDNRSEKEEDRDVWNYLLKKLGAPFSGLSQIPEWVDTSYLESSDWSNTN